MKKIRILLGIIVLYSGFTASSMTAAAMTGQTVYDRDLYNEIYKQIASFQSSFTVSYRGDEEAAEEQLKLILEDIRKKDSYSYENMTGLEATLKPNGHVTTIQFTVDFLTTKEKEDYVDEEVEKVLAGIRKEKLSEQEKIKAVHDYIAMNIEYSNDTYGSSHSVYTALTEKRGVCQAYSLLLHKMLSELGFEMQYVKGKAGGAAHSWNLVKLTDEWRHIDVTWDDPLDDNVNTVRYNYFLKTDQEMMKTHSWNTAEYSKAVSKK